MTRPSTPPNATRAAATLALEHGLELATIAGTGADGKITKGDVAKIVDAGVRGLTPEQQAEWNREHQLRQPVDQVTITPAQRVAVIATIRENPEIGNVAALRAAGVAGTRGQLAQFVDDDDELAGDIREARGYGNERIVAEITRRAIDGWDEPVFHDGEIVGSVRKFDGRLLTLLAKAHVPEFRDVTRHELTGPNGGPVEVQNTDVADALDRFGATLRRLAGSVADEPGGNIREAATARPALPPGEPRS
jgi:hypothetical protein